MFESRLLARCFHTVSMALDKNEKKLVEKLVTVLELLDASKQDIQLIKESQKVDENFLTMAGQLFDNTDACTVCSHAFHSWRKTLDDETVLHFIDDWISWKKDHRGSGSQAPVIKMKKR